jgi:hypothetical protein
VLLTVLLLLKLSAVVLVMLLVLLVVLLFILLRLELLRVRCLLNRLDHIVLFLQLVSVLEVSAPERKDGDQVE